MIQPETSFSAPFIRRPVATSLLTLGSVGGLAEHYVGAAPAAQHVALGAPVAIVH